MRRNTVGESSRRRLASASIVAGWLDFVGIKTRILYGELKRSEMKTDDQLVALEHAISTEAARTDALLAAVAGLLEAARGFSEVAKAVTTRLEQEYSRQRAKSQGGHYLQNFEAMREYLRKLVE